MSGGLKGEALSYLTYHLTNGELGRDWGPEAFLPALKLANANGLLYPFLKVVSDRIPLADPIRKLFKEEESKAEEVRRTVAFLMELLEGSGVDYLFIKLYRGFDYLPRDVDLLLKEEELALVMKLLRERGFKPLGFRKVEAKYFKPGLVRVDLYTDMRYLGLEFLSKEFLWEGTRYEEFLGLTIPIPNPVADLLINSLHVLLGHRYLSLLDFLYLDRLTRMGGRNVRVAFKYALKYGWGGSFLYLLKLLREVREAIQEGREVRFPMPLPARYALSGSHKVYGLPLKFKSAFLASTLMDRAYCTYRALLERYEQPEAKPFKLLSKVTYLVRYLVGDAATQG